MFKNSKKKCNIHWHKYINIVEYETSYDFFDNENKYDYWIKHFIPNPEPKPDPIIDFNNIRFFMNPNYSIPCELNGDTISFTPSENCFMDIRTAYLSIPIKN